LVNLTKGGFIKMNKKYVFILGIMINIFIILFIALILKKYNLNIKILFNILCLFCIGFLIYIPLEALLIFFKKWLYCQLLIFKFKRFSYQLKKDIVVMFNWISNTISLIIIDTPYFVSTDNKDFQVDINDDKVNSYFMKQDINIIDFKQKMEYFINKNSKEQFKFEIFINSQWQPSMTDKYPGLVIKKGELIILNKEFYERIWIYLA